MANAQMLRELILARTVMFNLCSPLVHVREGMERALDELDGTELNGRKIRLIEENRKSRSRSRSGSRKRSRYAFGEILGIHGQPDVSGCQRLNVEFSMVGRKPVRLFRIHLDKSVIPRLQHVLYLTINILLI